MGFLSFGRPSSAPAPSKPSSAPGTSEEGARRKLTKKEKEAAEKEMRRRMPQRAMVSRNGVYEMVGHLHFTWAVGQIPGGPFVPIAMVAKGHDLYIFESGVAGARPSAKPKLFLHIKRAEVLEVGLLLNPPLPPHINVFRLSFSSKQFGHKSFFFKARQP